MAHNTTKVVHHIFKRNKGDKFLESVLSHLLAARVSSVHHPFRFPGESAFPYSKGSARRGIECLQKNLLAQHRKGSRHVSGNIACARRRYIRRQ